MPITRKMNGVVVFFTEDNDGESDHEDTFQNVSNSVSQRCYPLQRISSQLQPYTWFSLVLLLLFLY